MLNLIPYLLFDGNCAEAMAFYKSCLGGELTLLKAVDSPMKSLVPPEHDQKIVNANLRSGPIHLSASDWLHPTRARKKGNAVCLFLNGGTHEELREIFDKLSAGADQAVTDPLRDMAFGTYGALTDKYGTRWMFHGEKS
jgi:PhnB protein